MNVLLRLAPFVKKWEGGLSSKQSDSAKNDPSPWLDPKTGYHYHTNKGVTWATFRGLSPKLGYALSKDNFINMPDILWGKIVKDGYWSMYPLDKISHLPRIQAVIFTWAWGSGGGGSESQLAKWQRSTWGLSDTDITKKEIVENFAKYVNVMNEKVVFDSLCEWRKNFFISLNQPANLNGWLNRLEDFKKLMR